MPSDRNNTAKDELVARLKALEKLVGELETLLPNLDLQLAICSEDINLARAVRLDPSLRNIKDKKTAVRLVKLAGRRIQAEVEAGLPIEIEYDQAYCGDSATILKNFPANTFHACITDPPWLCSSILLSHATKERFLYSKSCIELCVTTRFFTLSWGMKITSITRMNSRAWVLPSLKLRCFGGSSMLFLGVGSGCGSMTVTLSSFLLAVKGSPVLTSSTKISSFKDFAAVPSRSLIHPNEKPVELVKDILKDCTFEGNIDTRPVRWSGVVGAACKEMKRKFVVCERDEKFYKAICKRLGVKVD